MIRATTPDDFDSSETLVSSLRFYIVLLIDRNSNDGARAFRVGREASAERIVSGIASSTSQTWTPASASIARLADALSSGFEIIAAAWPKLIPGG